MLFGSIWWKTLLVCLLLTPLASADVHADAGGGQVHVRPLAETAAPGTVLDTIGTWETGVPLPPTVLEARIDGPDVVLTWGAPLHGHPSAYRVYRAEAPNANGPQTLARDGHRAAWAPLQEVPGNTTTFRDTGVELANNHYVYVVTAVHDPPGVRSGTSGGTQHGGSLELPSNPAYTWNTFSSCQWFENNVPDQPFVEFNWDCFPPLGSGPARLSVGS